MHTVYVSDPIHAAVLDELRAFGNVHLGYGENAVDYLDVCSEVDAVLLRAEVFDREKTIDLGGVRVRLLWLGPGHTLGDTAIFVEDDSVIFSGDLAMRKAFPAFTAPLSSIDKWLEALDTMAALRPKQVVGAHYGMGDASIISEYRDFLRALKARVAEMKAQGKSSDETGVTLRNDTGVYEGGEISLFYDPMIAKLVTHAPTRDKAIDAQAAALDAFAIRGIRHNIPFLSALMAHPRLLILDEPCAGLDPVAREHFLGFLQRLGTKRGAPSLILVTHHVEEIMPCFSHALLLREGRVLAAGERRAALNSARLSDLFGAPCRLVRRRERYGLKVEPSSKGIM